MFIFLFESHLDSAYEYRDFVPFELFVIQCVFS
uniref:Uncharacterized protein n=1 Tax=virus sp. ct9pU4 TaxID=2828248 RepID=A0A8S5RBM1_9VIRU|nr:MAG TPA: hypothetical protein [virus sp. ct9pU4]